MSVIAWKYYLDEPNGGFSSQLIQDAIDPAVDADTISILEGKYAESGSVINKKLLVVGSGTSGSTDTLIVLDVVSARAEEESPVGSHSGIIIYSSDVAVEFLHINGNGPLGTCQYHQGIITLYGRRAGGNYGMN